MSTSRLINQALLFGCLVLDISIVSSLAPPVNRRDLLIIGGSLAGIGITNGGLIFPEEAFAAEGPLSAAPVAVLGAGGRTGALCVAACLERGLPVRALTRTGAWEPPAGTTAPSNNLFSSVACDIKDLSALEQGIRGCQAVIYAASASKKGGNAKEIDNDGVATAGDACLKAEVKRYVVLSSTAVTRPRSLGYIFTNQFGGIMGEKRRGEERMYASYSAGSSASSFTIIRPGGLEEPKKNEVLGPPALEISQGDILAGTVSRADLAEVAVELALSSASNLKNTAVELYYANSAQPCERRFKAFLSNGLAPRLRGGTYDELFRGIKPDVDYYEP